MSITSLNETSPRSTHEVDIELEDPALGSHPETAHAASNPHETSPRDDSAGQVNPDVRNGFLSLVDQAVVSGTSFATAVILGRSFSTGDFGIFYLALTLVWAVRSIQEQIIATPYMVLCHHKHGRRLSSYGGSTLLHQCILSAVSTLGVLGFALIATATGSSFASIGWVLLGAVPAILLREHIRVVALSHLRLVSAVVFDSSIMVLQIGGLLLLAYTDSLTLTTAFGAMGGSSAVGCLVWFLAKQQAVHFDRRRFRSDWRRNWTLGKWALLSHFVGSSTPYALPWILLATHGEAAAGILAACTSVIGLPRMFVAGLANFIFPRSAHAFCNGGIQALCQLLWRTSLVYVAALGAFCVAVLFAGGSLMHLVYGSDYGDTGTILTVLALQVLVKSVGNVVGHGLWAVQWPRANFAADFCSTVVTLAVAFYLIGSLSVLAIAIAMLAGAALGAIVRAVTFHRVMGTLKRQLQTT